MRVKNDADVINYQCHYYLTSFLFKNEFYKHLENSERGRRANLLLCLNHSFKKSKTFFKKFEIYSFYSFIEALNFSNFIKVKEKLGKVIKSLFDFVYEIDIDQVFQRYHYVKVVIKLKFKKNIDDDCINIECFVFFINRA